MYGTSTVRFLSLAAAPTFAVMAIVTAAFDIGPADMLCSAAAFPLNGMAVMYALMSVFHAAPWLRRFGTVDAEPPPDRIPAAV